MTVTALPRFGLTDWTAGGDPFTRTQRRADNGALDQFAARAEQGPQSHVPTPTAPTLTTATTGGTLAPSTYGYRITALSAASGSFSAGETRASPETTIVVPAGTNTNVVNLTWAAVAGSNGYRVYGRTPSGEQLLATVAAGVTVWQDTGANPPGAALPTYDTTPGMPPAGIHGRFYWSTDDRGGRLWYDTGAAMVDVGPGPVAGPQSGSTALIVAAASAATSDDVLRVRGKTGQTGMLLRVTNPVADTDLFTVDSTGYAVARAGLAVNPVTPDDVAFVVAGFVGGAGDLQNWNRGGATVGRVGNAGNFTISPSSAAVVPVTVNGKVGQSVDLQQWQVNGATKANLSAAGGLTLTDALAVGGAATVAGTLAVTGALSAASSTLNSGDLTLTAGAVRLNNTASGRVLYQDGTATYVGAIDAARDLYLRAQGADAIRASAGTVKTPFALWAGAGALGVTNAYVILTDNGGGASGRAVVQAGHPSATNTDLALLAKGSGNVLTQSGSTTTASFGTSPFIMLASGSDSFYIKDTSSPEPGVMAVIGGGVSLGNTNLYIRYHGNAGSDTLGQVVLGAADSAGAGYRTMRLPN